MKGSISRYRGRFSPVRILSLLSNWPDIFVLLLGGLLMFSGITNVAWAFRESRMLDILDPLSLFPFRNLILTVGLIEIALAYLCLFTRKRLLIFGLMSWLFINFAAYRFILWTMGWHHPYVIVGPVTNVLRISPRICDVILAVIVVLLTVGSGLVAWYERRTAPAIESVKMSCPACGKRVQFPRQKLGQQASCPYCRTAINLAKPENLKMICFLCNGHIEFSSANLGQKIACPHCKATITLMKPKNIKTSCPSCGGHIEIPLHGLGQTIACPHCAANVTLQLPI